MSKNVSSRNNPQVLFKVHISIKKVNTVQPARKNPITLFSIVGSV